MPLFSILINVQVKHAKHYEVVEIRLHRTFNILFFRVNIKPVVVFEECVEGKEIQKYDLPIGKLSLIINRTISHFT